MCDMWVCVPALEALATAFLPLHTQQTHSRHTSDTSHKTHIRQIYMYIHTHIYIYASLVMWYLLVVAWGGARLRTSS